LQLKTHESLRLVFLIRSLDFGGAERQLLLLTRNFPRTNFEFSVVCFYENGKLFRQFADAGVTVIPLDKKGRWDIFPFLFRLNRQIRKIKPDVIYSFLAVPNILGAFMKIINPGVCLLMGVRGSSRDLNQYDWLYRLSFWLESRAARFANAIIVNSHAGFEQYTKTGFPASKMTVIQNGIDTESFVKETESGKHLRLEWGVPVDAPLVGMIGRLDPVKDHSTFIEAAGIVKQSMPQVRFVVIGDGPTEYLDHLKGQAGELGLTGCIRWENTRPIIQPVYNALDILCLSSKGEGFPNVIGEAMACGVPCVATGVGDIPEIIGDTGFIANPGDPSSLAEGINKMLSRTPGERHHLGERASARIRTLFSVDKMVQDTVRVIQTSAGKKTNG